MTHGAPIGMFGGCHRSAGLVGNAIMVFTTWAWRWFKPSQVASHSSVGFIYADGYREIYEAREGKSWQGPIPVQLVKAWEARDPKKRRFTMYDIPAYLICDEGACRRLSRCEDMLRVWTYSMRQLPRMGIRKWLPFIPMKPTPNAVVCSEAATIILGPQVNVCQMTGRKTPDQVTPFDFEQAMKKLTAKPKHEPSDTSDAYKD